MDVAGWVVSTIPLRCVDILTGARRELSTGEGSAGVETEVRVLSSIGRGGGDRSGLALLAKPGVLPSVLY